MIRRIAVLSALTLLTAGAAQAQDVAALRKACKADIAAHCKDVKAGGGRILQCLNANSSALAPDCKTALDALADKAKEKRGK